MPERAQSLKNRCTFQWGGRTVPGRIRLASLIVWLVVGLSSSSAIAGLAASQVVVVVNGSSFQSRTLANHFVSLRRIPAANVVVLSDVPNSEVIPVDDFREKILKPLFAVLSERKLDHIQCIAYSSDFPTGIDIASDLKAIEKRDKVFTSVASINGLTFLYGQVLQKNPAYIALNSNYYARKDLDEYFTNPAGQLTKAKWQEFQRLAKGGDHEQASAGYEALFNQLPHQFPVAYLAAAEAAQAGDSARAVDLLQKAIAAGWNAGGFLADDERFKSVREEAGYQVLQYSVDENLRGRQPAMGFDAQLYWTPNGIPLRDRRFGVRYLLSIMLGVTRGAGNTLAEAITVLERSASADFTHPDGAFFFSVTGDVRSQTRKWGVIGAVDDLEAMGYDARIIRSITPQNYQAILGAQLGRATVDLDAANVTLLPGSIVENLTSFGGVMTAGSGHTKLTEFLKQGAAGSSGTVTEPYAVQEKFPLPYLYPHYAAGASLIEAFYMNVSGPYQLLIVGDPLCQPFSNAPRQSFGDEIRYLDKSQPLSLKLNLDGPTHVQWNEEQVPNADRKAPMAPSYIAVVFDGNTASNSPVRPNLNLKFGKQPDGYHEVVVRLTANDPLTQCSEATIPIWLGPTDAVVLTVEGSKLGNIDEQSTGSSQPTAPANASISLRDETIKVAVRGKNAERISVWHESEKLGVVEGAEGTLDIELSKLGRGPVRLHAKAELADNSSIQSIPLHLAITP